MRLDRSPPRVALMAAILVLLPAAFACGGEEGGTGLVRVDQAFSLDIGRPLVSVHAGYFSRDFTGGDDRFFTITPGVTLGLGAGFEGAASLALEGLSSRLDGEPFDRRFDVRRRDLTTKLRWTAPLGTTRLRAGVQGLLGLPLGDEVRAGGTQDPDRSFDAGLTGLLSTNVGWFDFPIRLHANAGYWWSRDDGAFYDRSHPVALPVSGAGATGNDLALFGLALEAGLRRVSLFAELVTEQFVEARSAVRGKENLWTLTPGLRTKLTPTIELTAAVSFNLSSDDPSTAFDPDDVYPDYELRAGLTLGDILARERSEKRQLPPLTAAMDEEPAAAVEEEPAASAPAAAPAAAPVPAATEPAAVRRPAMPATRRIGPAQRLEAIERRLDRLELQGRLGEIESRLQRLESGPGEPTATPAAEVTAPPTPAPAKAVTDTAAAVPDTTAGAADEDLMRRLAAVEAELAAQKAQPVAPPPPAPARAVTDTVPPAPQAAAPTPADRATFAPGSEDSMADVAAVDAVAPAAGDTVRATPATIEAAIDTVPAAPQPAVESEAERQARIARHAARLQRSLAADAPAAAPPADRATARELELARRVGVLEAELAARAGAVEEPVTTPAPPTEREDALARQVEELRRRLDDLAARQPEPSPERLAVIQSGGATPEVRVPLTVAPAAAAPAPAVTAPATLTPAPPATTTTAAPSAVPSPAAPVPSGAPGLPVAGAREQASSEEDLASGQRPFPLAVGDTVTLRSAPLAGGDLASAPDVREELASLAGELAAHRDVRLVLLVHGAGADREAELARTDALARDLRAFLVGAGADSAQVQPLGMGLAEPLAPAGSPDAARNARIEITRIR